MMDKINAGGSAGGHARALDVIIDTDIGTDVDDAYALLFAIASPELNVRGLTLVHGDILLRARITAKLLKLVGRSDIPVVFGESYPINRDRPIVWLGHEGNGLDFSDVEEPASDGEHAAEFIARTASENAGEVTLITIGPLTNAGVLVRDFPEEASKLRGVIAMASCFNGFGPENAEREHNSGTDPEAMRLLLESGVPVLIVGLNVTKRTFLAREHLRRISGCETPLSEFMVHMTEDWFKVIGNGVTFMHDPLAVATFLRPDLVSTVPVSAEVSESLGCITYRESGPDSPIRVSTSVDADSFHELFYSRILDATASY